MNAANLSVVSVLVMILLWTLPGAARAQDFRELVGCYATRSGAWSDPVRHARISGATVPDTIELRAEPTDVTLDPEGHVLAPVATMHLSTARLGLGGAYWTARGDSARLVWTTGTSGLIADVTIADGELVGVVQSFWDEQDGAPDPRAPFEARRIECAD